MNKQNHCAMMLDSGAMCRQPVVGELAVADEASDAPPLSWCAGHLREIERANAKYEKRITDYVTARFPLTDPDLRRTQAWIILNRRELNTNGSQPRVVWRDRKMLHVTLSALSAAELQIEAAAFNALGELLTAEGEALALGGEMVEPFCACETTRVGEAENKLNAAAFAAIQQFPERTPEEHAAGMLAAYWRDVDPFLRDQIRARLLEFFAANRRQ